MPSSTDVSVSTPNMRPNRGMLWATWLTAIAAIVGVGFSSWYNRETVIIARDTLSESRKARDDEQGRFTKEQRYETQKVEQSKAESARLERLARSPLLVQYQCCNPVAVVFERTSTGGRRIRWPNSDEMRFFGTDYNRDHVIRIANFGQGPALRVRATWHPQKVKYSNGSEETISNTTNGSHTKPIHLTSQEHALIFELPPYCYREDKPSFGGNRLADVEGYLELTCYDSSDDKLTFEYNFDMKVFCNIQQIGKGITAGSIMVNIAEAQRNKPSLPQNTPSPTLD